MEKNTKVVDMLLCGYFLLFGFPQLQDNLDIIQDDLEFNENY